MMKKILVPMDFTDVSVNALRYALQAFPESDISVLHVRVGAFYANAPIPVTPGDIQEIYWTEALHKFILKELKVDEFPSRVSIYTRYGKIISEIIKFSNDNKVEALVMGTRDKYNYFNQWFGTVSIGAVKKIDLPIYLIPKYASFQTIKNVMIASDDQLTDPSLIQKIKTWNKDYNAFVKFLHIQRTENESFRDESKTIVKELFEKNDPEFSFEISILKDQDISHSLLASAYDLKADLLLVIPEDQNFMETLLFQSISKDLILQSDIPLLFLKNKS